MWRDSYRMHRIAPLSLLGPTSISSFGVRPHWDCSTKLCLQTKASGGLIRKRLLASRERPRVDSSGRFLQGVPIARSSLGGGVAVLPTRIRRAELNSASSETEMSVKAAGSATAQTGASDSGAGVEKGAAGNVKELVLNRDDFTRVITVVAVMVPVKRTSEIMQKLKKELLNMSKRKNVECCPDNPSKRLLLLNPDVRDPATLEGLSEAGKDFVNGDEDIGTTTFDVRIDYSYLAVDEVLKQLLTPLLGDVDLATSFESVGHVAHLNLRDELLPYKKVIAQVLMDKNSTIKTVVNKIGTISAEFRTFPMEVLAGEPNTKVELRESGCVFRFDFAKVYWNSRLQTEHARLVGIISRSHPGRKPIQKVVCDMMAGVGPFAVPLARQGHRVFANDLNPDSFRSLKENAKRNKCQGRLTASNICGRQFTTDLIEKGRVFHHAILNLPNSALDFLDIFRDVKWGDKGFASPPMVHVYCFSKEKDFEQDALDRANAVMGTSLTRAQVKMHAVRDVAPNKIMLCLSFRAPEPGIPSTAQDVGTINSDAVASTGSNSSKGGDVQGGGSKRQRRHING